MITDQSVSTVQNSINQNPYLNSEIRVQHQNGKILLEGQVSSFFEKQMAQETIKQLDAFEYIENAIEVFDNLEVKNFNH